MTSKIDILVKKIRVIIDWYEENSCITHSDYSVSIEKAEELLAKLEEIK